MRLKTVVHLILQISDRFNDHDVWALSSHIAMSLLTALFPFLIAVTSLASFMGAGSLSEDAVRLILDTWPQEVAVPIAREVERVLTVKRTDVLTVSFLLSLYFASSAVGSLRMGLNRAYGMRENRNWLWIKISSILAVVLGAITMLCFAFLLVLGPLIWRTLLIWIPQLQAFGGTVALMRISIPTALFIVALFFVHIFVPAERRSLKSVCPGILITVVLWVMSGLGFGWYLSNYSGNYVSTYGSLATAMMTLVFLYLFSTVFLLGGEINGAWRDWRRQEKRL